MNVSWWVNSSQLDDDQKDVIKLGLDGTYLVIGPPGSGKTNLLLLRANYLYLAGKSNILVLTFGRTLKEYIASGAGIYSFPASKIMTYHGWAKNTLREFNIRPDDKSDFLEHRNALTEQLNDLIQAEQISKLYDVIFIDEAQDYTIEEMKLLFRLGTKVFATADSRQQIYDRSPNVIEFIKSSVDETIPLRYHYRNGKLICRLADHITKHTKRYEKLEPTSNYDETSYPSSVKRHKCSSIEEECELIIKEIETQLQAYPDELIGVISPTHESLEKIKDRFLNSPYKDFCIIQDYESGYMPFNKIQPICLCTLHSAKGLEFRALHMAACDTLKKFYKKNRNMTFTGVTRAKTSLSIYYSGEIYGYFDSALSSILPRLGLPEISEVFGQGD